MYKQAVKQKIALCAIVERSSLKETVFPAVKSVLECTKQFAELHIVGSSREGLDQETRQLLAQYEKRKGQDKPINIVYHKSSFRRYMVSSKLFYLVDIPSLNWFSKDAVDDLVNDIRQTQEHITRWSFGSYIHQSHGNVFWNSLLIMLMFFNQARSTFTSWGRSLDGQDVTVTAIMHGATKVKDEADLKRMMFPRRYTRAPVVNGTGTEYSCLDLGQLDSSKEGFFYYCKRQRNTGTIALTVFLLWLIIFACLPYLTWMGVTGFVGGVMGDAWSRSLAKDGTKDAFVNVMSRAFAEDAARQQAAAAASSSWLMIVPFNRVVTIFIIMLFIVLSTINKTWIKNYWYSVFIYSALWPVWLILVPYGKYFSRKRGMSRKVRSE